MDCCRANILGCEHEYTRPQLLSGYVRETRITLAGPLLSSHSCTHSLAERMDTSFPMRQFTCDSFGLGFVCCPKAWPNTLVENQRLEVPSVPPEIARRAPVSPTIVRPVRSRPWRPRHGPSTGRREAALRWYGLEAARAARGPTSSHVFEDSIFSQELFWHLTRCPW